MAMRFDPAWSDELSIQSNYPSLWADVFSNRCIFSHRENPISSQSECFCSGLFRVHRHDVTVEKNHVGISSRRGGGGFGGGLRGSLGGGSGFCVGICGDAPAREGDESHDKNSDECGAFGIIEKASHSTLLAEKKSSLVTGWRRGRVPRVAPKQASRRGFQGARVLGLKPPYTIGEREQGRGG